MVDECRQKEFFVGSILEIAKSKQCQCGWKAEEQTCQKCDWRGKIDEEDGLQQQIQH